MHRLSNDEVLLIPSNQKALRNNDIFYDFYQDSSFWYLTGWPDANAILVLTKEKALFFCEDLTKHSIIWDGADQGVDVAQTTLEISCYPIEFFARELESLNMNNYFSTKPNYLLSMGIQSDHFCLGTMRATKSKFELTHIQSAIDASINGHLAIMHALQPGVTERSLYGTWLKTLFDLNLTHEAYPAIIATGKNACTLHYQKLGSTCLAGQLLLVDAGMVVQGYAADLTRTMPVNGEFSDVQKRVYEHVLFIQESVASYCQLGMSLSDLNEYADVLYLSALKDLGVAPQLREYAPHGIGHSLGLDVHDIGLGKTDPITEGAVITIEPGLYFRDTEYSGIGVRIEDNYVMNNNGLHCLSSGLPKSIIEIEDKAAVSGIGF